MFVGSNLTYTITVTNIGPGIAFGTMVTDTPPDSVVFISATPSQGACVTDVFGRVICNLQDLTNGTTASISLLVDPSSSASLTNLAEASAFSPDPSLANNTATNIDSALVPATLAATPASQSFGAVFTGTTAQVSFVVTNSGATTLAGTAVVGGAPFAIASGSPFNVTAFGSTNVFVNFTPLTAGNFTSQVVFASNGGGATNTVTGIGTVAQQVVLPASLNYGLLAVGQSSTQSFSVVNEGAALLSGTATVLSGPFTTISGTPYNVASGQTGTVDVAFNPVAVGAFTGSVVFTSNGGVSTNAVTGSGAVAPVAGFNGTPTNGAATLLVNFTDASSGTVTGRLWAFGDGGTSTLTSPSHPYTNAGTFSVSLTVLGPLGSNTLARPNFITVTNFVGAPVAAFTASPLSGVVPLLVNFTDASTGSITNHSWLFGDGGASALTSPSHTYSNAGIYSVTLTVSGPAGSSSTNRANLITVTNAVSTPPTVTIARPGNGMLYPPATNLAVTIVANAVANDGGTVGNIEFFDGITELGSTTSNPGTNVFHPTPGIHVLSARASEIFGLTNISAGVTITVGAKNSPLGDWEVKIAGADKGYEFLTFEDDYSASGFGIRLKTFGLDDVSGHWSFAAKGLVTGPFLEETGSTTNWTGTLSLKAKSLKGISATVPTASGTFHWKGVLATTFPDVSGTWTGAVTVVKTAAAVNYIISSNATDAAVFDIATSAAPGTVVGQLLVTSHDKVVGYVTFDSKSINFSGTFSATSPAALKLKGTDTAAEKITIDLFK